MKLLRINYLATNGNSNINRETCYKADASYTAKQSLIVIFNELIKTLHTAPLISSTKIRSLLIAKR